MALFDVPNLDGLSVEAGDYRDAGNVLYVLAEYAHLKAEAMERRCRGELGPALRCENRMQELYDRLPGWARW